MDSTSKRIIIDNSKCKYNGEYLGIKLVVTDINNIKDNEKYLCININISQNEFINKDLEYFQSNCNSPIIKKALDLNISCNKLDSLIIIFYSFNQLISLDISYNNINDTSIHELEHLNIEILKNLKCLNLSYNKISDLGIKYLVNLPLSQLEKINLSGNSLTNESLNSIKFSKNLPKLEALIFTSNNIDDENLKKIEFETIKIENLDSNCCYLSWIKHLDLSSNNFSEIGIKYFLMSHNFLELTFLNISNNNISDSGLELLSKCYFKKLKELDLYNNNISDNGMKHFEKMKLNELIFLNLSGNLITDNGVRYLSKNTQILNLETLLIFNNSLESNFVDELKKCIFINSLKTIEVADNALGYKALVNLFEFPFKSLENLNLSSTSLDETTIVYLTQCTYLSNLRSLDLSNNEIGDEGIKYLKECNFLNLTNFQLSNCDITIQGFAKINIQKFPALKILNISNNSINILNLDINSCKPNNTIESIIISIDNFYEENKYIEKYKSIFVNAEIDVV